MSHRDFVRTSWGGYYVDPFRVEEAKETGRRWAALAIAKMRKSLAVADRCRVKKTKRARRTR